MHRAIPITMALTIRDHRALLASASAQNCSPLRIGPAGG
jgi:hypothetical protein